jgi:tetratricopeptide (TPR) repeat protein
MVRFFISGLLLIASATSASAHGDLHWQIEEITKRLAVEPKNAHLFLRRAELHRLHQNWTAAFADYDRALAHDAHLEQIEFFRSRAEFESGDLSKARQRLDRFLARRPDHMESHITRSRVLYRLKEYEAAAQDFDQAIQSSSSPLPEFYFERARALAAIGDEPNMRRAVSGLDEGIRRLGNLVALQTLAIDLECTLQSHDAALARIDQLLEQADRKESWLVQRAEVLLKAGRTADAAAALRSAQASISELPERHQKTEAVLQLKQRIQARLVEAGE